MIPGGDAAPLDARPAPDHLAHLLSRRQVLQRATALGAGGLVLSAVPVVERIFGEIPVAAADDVLADPTLQAYADTLIPGRKALVTDLGKPIHPLAIAGVHSKPGAVEADALLLFHSPLIGFDLLAPAFLAELETRSLARGAPFLNLPWDKRVAVCVDGLDADTPTVLVWQAAAAVPAAAFLVAAMQRNATIDTASGYQVMGHPGIAPQGYADYSYRRKLSRERTASGSLP
jgi:hypothetical protein